MTDLLDILRRQIQLNGPMTVAAYMKLCLAHPEHGYYRKKDPFGPRGDFTTAPEISQMFGELIGLWAAAVWQSMGEPAPLQLVELGPGRGTLMADALRAAGRMVNFIDAAEVHLVETSPLLRQKQEAVLQEYAPTWHDDVTTLSEAPTIFVANEFLDALPIRQFQRTREGWHERLVGLDGNERLQFVLSPPQLANPMVPDSLKNAAIGAVAEICPAAMNVVRHLAERLVSTNGAAIFIDYGHPHSAAGDTFQAVKNHTYHDPLANPGDTDLTAHVDFAILATAAKATGAMVYGPITQKTFLETLGIRERAKVLTAAATEIQKTDIEAALARLTDAGAMGRQFKVLAISGPRTPPPPGFE